MSSQKTATYHLDRWSVRCQWLGPLLANAAVVTFILWYNVNQFSVSVPARNAVGLFCGFGPIDKLPIYFQIILYALAIVVLGKLLTLYFVLLLKFDNFLAEFFHLGVSANPTPECEHALFDQNRYEGQAKKCDDDLKCIHIFCTPNARVEPVPTREKGSK